MLHVTWNNMEARKGYGKGEGSVKQTEKERNSRTQILQGSLVK